MNYVVSPVALDDIDEAAAWIEEHEGDAAADGLIDDFYAAFARLAELPGLGHRRPDITALPVHFWTVRDRYAVVYRKATPLQIVRVLSWKRDVETMLQDQASPPPPGPPKLRG